LSAVRLPVGLIHPVDEAATRGEKIIPADERRDIMSRAGMLRPDARVFIA